MHEKGVKPVWTVMETLHWTVDYFSNHKIENPRASAEILLAHALGLNRIDLYLRHDQPLQQGELKIFRDFIKRRLKSEPVGYIVGHKEFWSLDFHINKSVLIPRPETECLVESALKYIRTEKRLAAPRVLELGTGSGAISISIASECPQGRYWASDISIDAITVARANAHRLLEKETVGFFLGHWFEAIGTDQKFDLIISNPPYIPTFEIPKLDQDVKGYEPLLALDGGQNGLEHIAHIIESAYGFLEKNGILMFEIGYDQREAVARIGRDCGVYSEIMFSTDYYGHDRIAIFVMG
ncbi:MAG: peptide chain release factor N(5)-glutamine methyltransferase [Desulfobacteraceae bacterium]|nr:peptide chain release factor N(5)-glutamine methyltransferase [Desulfobacteraceae bacterium]